MTLMAQKTRCPRCGSEPDDGKLLAIATARKRLIMETLDDEPGCLGAGVGRTQPADDGKAIKPCAWVCTDYDGSGAVGMTKELAQEAAGAGCTEFFGLIPGPALATRLLALADELDAELDGGAKWSKAQHTCSSVSVALRDLARAASAT